MTSNWVVATLPLLLPLCAHTQSTPASTVTVFVNFESTPSEVSFQRMKGQAELLIRPLGFVLDWRQLSENRGSETFAKLAVIRFDGVCRGEASVPLANPEADGTVILGSSLVENGHMLPFADVHCDQVRLFLTANRLKREFPLGESDYGRALGGVVAHELYHILLDNPGHQQQGVGRSHHRPRQLLSPHPSFSLGARGLLRQHGSPAVFANP